MSFIQKFGFISLLQLFLFANLKADMLFYYSAAILPSIMSTEQTKVKIVGNYTGDFISVSGESYPMTAIVAPDLSMRLFILDSFNYSERSEAQMDGTLQVKGNTVSATLNGYVDVNDTGIATPASSKMSINAIYTPTNAPLPYPDEDEDLSVTNTSMAKLTGTYNNGIDHGTFVLQHHQDLNFETTGFTEFEPAFGTFVDEVGTVEIDENGHISSYFGTCQYSGQFDQVKPNMNVFSLTIDLICDSRPTTTYTGYGIQQLSDFEGGDKSVIFSVSNGTESIVDHLDPVY